MRITFIPFFGLLLAACASAPPSPDTTLCAATSATADERIAACTREIDSGRLSTKDLVDAFNKRGNAWSRKRNYDRAIAEYSEAIRLDPNHALAYTNRGIAWDDKRDYDKAIADFTEAIRLDPKHALAYNNRGIAWRNKGDLDRAIADFTEAIRLDPKDASAYNNRGVVWDDKRDHDRAIADYTEAIRLDPKGASAFYNRGNTWDSKGEYDKAIIDYTEAIRLDPKSTSAYFKRARVWEGKNDYDKAIADYTEVIRLDPKDAGAYNNRGFAWSQKRDYDKAIADYTEAIRVDPNYAWAYNSRGNAWLGKNDLDRAIADFNDAIRLVPAFARAFANRAYAWLEKEEYEKSAADYRDALRLDPEILEYITIPHVAWSMAQLGGFDYDQAVMDQVIADIEDVMKNRDELAGRDPNNAKEYNLRAHVRRARGDYAQAIADHDQAIRMEPDNPETYWHRGYALHRKGDYDRAIAGYDEALRRKTEYNLVANRLRADAWFLRGDCAHAVADPTPAHRVQPAPDIETRDARRGLLLYGCAEFARAWENFSRPAARSQFRYFPRPLGGPYLTIWRYLSAARAAEPRALERLAQDADKLKKRLQWSFDVAQARTAAEKLANKPDERDSSEQDEARDRGGDWPMPLIELLLGKRTPADVTRASNAEGKPASLVRQRCEAAYFVSQWRLVRSETAAASALLRQAARLCPQGSFERRAALLDTARLDNGRAARPKPRGEKRK